MLPSRPTSHANAEQKMKSKRKRYLGRSVFVPPWARFVLPTVWKVPGGNISPMTLQYQRHRAAGPCHFRLPQIKPKDVEVFAHKRHKLLTTDSLLNLKPPSRKLERSDLPRSSNLLLSSVIPLKIRVWRYHDSTIALYSVNLQTFSLLHLSLVLLRHWIFLGRQLALLIMQPHLCLWLRLIESTW